MEKVFLLVSECPDSYYGDDVEIFEEEQEARNELKIRYNIREFAELYEATLIDNTGFRRRLF